MAEKDDGSSKEFSEDGAGSAGDMLGKKRTASGIQGLIELDKELGLSGKKKELLGFVKEQQDRRRDERRSRREALKVERERETLKDERERGALKVEQEHQIFVLKLEHEREMKRLRLGVLRLQGSEGGQISGTRWRRKSAELLKC